MLPFSWRSKHCEFSQVGMLLLSTTSHPLFLVILSFTTLPTVNSCHLLAKPSHFRHLISREKTLNGSNLEIFFSGIQIISLDIFVSIFCLFSSSSLPSLAAFFHEFPAILAFLLLPQLSPNIHKLSSQPQFLFHLASFLISFTFFQSNQAQMCEMSYQEGGD